MLCISGFVDDVRFSYHGANEPELGTTLHFEEVRQIARWRYQLDVRKIVLGRVDQNAVPVAESVIYDGLVLFSEIFTDHFSGPGGAIGICVCVSF